MTDFEADVFRALVFVAPHTPDHGASAWQVAHVMDDGVYPAIAGGALARLLRKGFLEVVGEAPNTSRRYGLTEQGRRWAVAMEA